MGWDAGNQWAVIPAAHHRSESYSWILLHFIKVICSTQRLSKTRSCVWSPGPLWWEHCSPLKIDSEPVRFKPRSIEKGSGQSDIGTRKKTRTKLGHACPPVQRNLLTLPDPKLVLIFALPHLHSFSSTTSLLPPLPNHYVGRSIPHPKAQVDTCVPSQAGLRLHILVRLASTSSLTAPRLARDSVNPLKRVISSVCSAASYYSCLSFWAAV